MFCIDTFTRLKQLLLELETSLFTLKLQKNNKYTNPNEN